MPKKQNCFSGRAYAKLCGVDEKSIRNAEKICGLIKVKKGIYRNLYDATDPINIKGIQVILANTQAGIEAEKTKPKKKTTRKKKEAQPVDASESLGDIGTLRIQKEREIIIEKQLKNEKARGELVDRKAVSRIFNKLWSVDSSQLIPIATKLAPEIASICGVDDPEVITKVREKIDTEIWRVLGHCKRIMSDYLAQIEADNIEEKQIED